MAKTLSSCNFYSHKEPERCLCEHLEMVRDFSELFVQDIVLFGSFSIEKEKIGKDEIEKSASLIAISHDLGKATDFFQKHLLKATVSSKKNRHSLISAIIGFEAASKVFNDSVIPYFVYAAIRNHHSDLNDFLDNFVLEDSDMKTLKEQWESVNKQKFEKLLDKIHYPLNVSEIDAIFKGDKILNNVRRAKRKVRSLLRSRNKDMYFFFGFLFSILVDADKADAAGKGSSRTAMFNRAQIPWDIAEKYVKMYIKPNAEKNKINELRMETYESIVSKPDVEKHFYVLDAPTGMGKTLSAFSFALKLREKVSEKKGYVPRIIYAMPFLSIIDQNAEVISDVFEKILKRAPYSNEVLVHHHLSEISFKTSELTDTDTNLSKNLIESWDSEIIITTFIQLFYSLFASRNSMLKKFHRILNGIIILDEVQAIPPIYYKLINETFSYMSKFFGTYIVLSTATQLLILQSDTATIPKKSEVNYSEVNRFEIIPKENKVSTDEFIEEAVKDLKSNPEKSFLIVVNTISYAEKVFKSLNESGISANFIYLSSFVVPSERRKRISEINADSNKRKVVVSTQVVEAGVDIDLDIVYRDLAPFDSIVQAAGRCNRNGLNKKGKVKVFEIVNENGRALGSYIYELFALERTKRLLDNKISDEISSRELSVNYAKQISEIVSKENSNEILEAIEKLNYRRVNDFKLIKEDIERFSVFIETDEALKNKIWEKYKQVAAIDDRFKRRNAFLKIKKEFYDYVVSIPAQIIQANTPPMTNGFYFVSNSQLDEYYDKATGFIRKGKDAIW